MISAGKLNCKIRLKKEQMKADGTFTVYIQISLNRTVKKISLGFSVLEKDFDLKNQRVKSSNQYHKDYNLLIEKKLADINTIEVNYRLSDRVITLEALVSELNNPTARIDFIKFREQEMERQKEILKEGTYRQQMTVLNKVKSFKSPLFFYEIDENYINDLKAYCKKKLKNNENTIATTIKSLKNTCILLTRKVFNLKLNFQI